MFWEKKGKIFDQSKVQLDWYVKSIMVPVPYLINDNRLRIFATFCDEQNIGRIGYIDVAPENPKKILGYSKKPLLDIGQAGAFDDNGVITASILSHEGVLYLYYSGFQLGNKVPYFIFSGLAASVNSGESFKRVSKTPFLERTNSELYARCAPVVRKNSLGFQLWYTGDIADGWTTINDKTVPLYGLKTMSSNNHDVWTDNAIEALPLNEKLEHGISLPSVWEKDGLHKMIYSIRTIDSGYTLGYAESEDGIHFARMDEQAGIEKSKSGWDSTMICFGSVFSYRDKTFLFYCGNDYGTTGLGYAELIDNR